MEREFIWQRSTANRLPGPRREPNGVYRRPDLSEDRRTSRCIRRLLAVGRRPRIILGGCDDGGACAARTVRSRGHRYRNVRNAFSSGEFGRVRAETERRVPSAVEIEVGDIEQVDRIDPNVDPSFAFVAYPRHREVLLDRKIEVFPHRLGDAQR